MRDIPIITFINKMDRESRDPFEILDEVEEKLALDTAPVTWPVGRSKTFCGSFNLANSTFRGSDTQVEPLAVNGPESIADRLPENERSAFIDELELAREACRPFDRASFPRRAYDAGLFSVRRSGISAFAISSTRSALTHRRRVTRWRIRAPFMQPKTR